MDNPAALVAHSVELMTDAVRGAFQSSTVPAEPAADRLGVRSFDHELLSGNVRVLVEAGGAWVGDPNRPPVFSARSAFRVAGPYNQ